MARDSNFPILAAAEQTLTLRPIANATEVENRIQYQLKFGPMIDRLMFERVVRGAAKGFLEDLAIRAQG